jgi:hypothetical protein
MLAAMDFRRQRDSGAMHGAAQRWAARRA